MSRLLLFLFSLLAGTSFGQGVRNDLHSGSCSRHPNGELQNSLMAVSKPHAKRQQQIDIKFYHLDLQIEVSNDSVIGNTLVKALALHNQLDTVSLELHPNLQVDSVLTAIGNGAFHLSGLSRNGGELNIILAQAADSGQLINTRIYYKGIPPVSGSFPTSGYFAGNGHKFSATPPYNAFTWFPCKQDLTDKADSSWFFISTSSGLKALSNGLLHQVVPLPNQKQRWEWKSSYPIAYYLIAFAVGNFNEETFYWKPDGRTDSMQISYYNYTNSHTPQILQVFSNLFGLYPFYREKLAMVSVQLGGGIENQTLIGMGPGAPESHEIMHQWFGDHVTNASWKHIMLNEGFAEWGISVWEEFQSGNSNPAARINRCNAYETSALTNGGSLYGALMDTATVTGVFLSKNLYYDKGAMIINTLRFEVNNDSLFFAGIRTYLNRFGGKSATAEDFRSVMEEITGMNLEEFFEHWYYGKGYPKFHVRWNHIQDTLYLQVNEQTNGAGNPLIKTSLEIQIQRSPQDTLIRVFIDANTKNFRIPLSGVASGLVIDPRQWVLNGNGSITRDPNLSVQTLTTPPEWILAPNPSTGSICLVGNHPKIKQVQIRDLSGKCVFDKAIRLNETILLPELKAGVYLVQTEDGRLERLVICPE